MRSARQKSIPVLFYLVLAILVCASVGIGRAQTQAPTGNWVWANGNSVVEDTSVTGVYGTLGIASPANTPPGVVHPATWTDGRGNHWLFGGQIQLLDGGVGVDLDLNDLWKFDPYTAEWTWVSGAGSNVPVPGTYDQPGAPSAANDPGGRTGASGWLDNTGNLWLFGGFGYDAQGNGAFLNDLWEFDPILSEWAWIGGLPNEASMLECGIAKFGPIGVASPSNQPGGRQSPSVWVDGAGTFWLFGGQGCDASETRGFLDDLWTYVPSTGQWTWVGGSNSVTTSGVYGTLGVASSTSFPGSRYHTAHWTDASGDLWLFGGEGFDSVGVFGLLNDLWRFSPSTGEWTWVSGSDTIGDENCAQENEDCARSGVYGTLGVSAPGNVPGGRSSPVGEAVANGNFLVFGGFINPGSESTYFNDLWEFNPGDGEWAWIGGSNTVVCGAIEGGVCVNGETGVYGTKGVPDATNYPGSRVAPAAWADKTGNFWMFGGDGFDSKGPATQLNDMWEYQLAPLAAPPVAATVTVTSSANPIFTKTAFKLTAHVTSTNVPPNPPGGSVVFSETDPTTGMSNMLGKSTVNASGDATLSLASFAVGTHAITAAYSGDGNNLGGTGSISEVVGDFSFTANSPASVTIASGGTATYNLTLMPLAPITAFPADIALTASGGPAGATYTFAPALVASGSAVTNVTLTVTVPVTAAAAGVRWPYAPGIPLLLAGLILPLVRHTAGRRQRRSLPALAALVVALLGAAVALGGCGNKFYIREPSSNPPNPPTPVTQTYTIYPVGTAGTLLHIATVTLAVN